MGAYILKFPSSRPQFGPRTIRILSFSEPNNNKGAVMFAELSGSIHSPRGWGYLEFPVAPGDVGRLASGTGALKMSRRRR